MTPHPLDAAPAPPPPRLLDLVRQVARDRFGQNGPGERHVTWVRRFILFHDNRHPRDLQAGDVDRFLRHVAQTEKNALGCLESAASSTPCRAATACSGSWPACCTAPACGGRSAVSSASTTSTCTGTRSPSATASAARTVSSCS